MNSNIQTIQTKPVLIKIYFNSFLYTAFIYIWSFEYFAVQAQSTEHRQCTASDHLAPVLPICTHVVQASSGLQTESVWVSMDGGHLIHVFAHIGLQ